MTIERIQLGYWYPRTTLHLTEIQDFFIGHKTPLHLDAAKLVALRSKLHIKSSRLVLGELEHVDMQAASDVVVRVFEDGLVTISDNHTNLQADVRELLNYFNKAFIPAVQYLTSIGAPTPKELAGIDHETPVFIVTKGAAKADAVQMLDQFRQELEFELDTKDMELYRGGEFFIVNVKPHFRGVEALIETWIYFKEFKSQLHHYLNLHRAIWTQIEAIKEEKTIRGWDVKAQRTRLETYKKTIELIEARIGQMDLYMASRSRVATVRGWDTYLSDVLQFRYTNLEHTHDYVRSLWVMTRQYVDSAIQVMAELNAQSTKTSVQALTVISSLGVIAGIINYLSLPKLPSVSQTGIEYFIILITVAILVNAVVQFVYGAIKYRVNVTEFAKDLHRYSHKR